MICNVGGQENLSWHACTNGVKLINTSSVPLFLMHSSKATKTRDFTHFLPNIICSESLIFHFEVHAQQEKQYKFGQLCAIWRKISAPKPKKERRKPHF